MTRWLSQCGALLCCLWAYASAVHCQELTVDRASTRLVGNVYLLDAHIDYALTPKALDALHNGVPLTLELKIEVTRSRRFLWDETVAALKQRYQIRYHPLTQQYLVNNLNTGVSEGYPTLRAALQALGQLRDFPMLDHSVLRPGEDYHAHLRVLLDIESLPAPLRPLAYLSRDWHLSSDWYSWPLQP